jgi:hypothetical protein
MKRKARKDKIGYKNKVRRRRFIEADSEAEMTEERISGRPTRLLQRG